MDDNQDWFGLSAIYFIHCHSAGIRMAQNDKRKYVGLFFSLLFLKGSNTCDTLEHGAVWRHIFFLGVFVLSQQLIEAENKR